MNQLLQKYNKMSRPVKASLWYTICSILQRSLSFITLPIFTRILTSSEYGLINVYQTWMNIFVIFATLNLQHGAFSSAMVKFEEDRDRYISAMQGLTTVITMGLFVIYLPMHKQINTLTGLTTGLMIAMGLEFIVNPAFGFWSGKKRFDYEYKPFVIITLINSILSPLLGFVMVINAKEGGVARLYAGVIVEVILFGSIYILNYIKGKRFFDKKYWKYALGFNVPLIPYYLSQIIFNQSDRLMIAKICGNDKAGIYGVAYSLALVLSFVLTAINNSFVPWKYKKFKNQDSEGVGKISTGIAFLIMVMLLMLILCAPEIIRIMAAKEYYAARWVVPPVAASMFFLFLAQLFINIEFYFEEKTMLVAGSILSAVVNIVLNYIFIKKYGFIAAGYTTLVSYILFVLCNYWCVRRVLKKHWSDKTIREIYQLRVLLVMSVVFLILMGLCTALYDHIFIRYTVLVIVMLVVVLNRKRIRNRVKAIRTMNSDGKQGK